jgi:hypothetical protein
MLKHPFARTTMKKTLGTFGLLGLFLVPIAAVAALPTKPKIAMKAYPNVKPADLARRAPADAREVVANQQTGSITRGLPRPAAR